MSLLDLQRRERKREAGTPSDGRLQPPSLRPNAVCAYFFFSWRPPTLGAPAAPPLARHGPGIVVSQVSPCGSAMYVAPEVLGFSGGFMIDWWSLGVLVYELLTGSPPWCDDNPLSPTLPIAPRAPVSAP